MNAQLIETNEALPAIFVGIGEENLRWSEAHTWRLWQATAVIDGRETQLVGLSPEAGQPRVWVAKRSSYDGNSLRTLAIWLWQFEVDLPELGDQASLEMQYPYELAKKKLKHVIVSAPLEKREQS